MGNLHDVEVDCTDYQVELYESEALVFVWKRSSRTGNSWRQQIKHGSGTFKRVLRELKRQAQPGSLAAEELAQCADTNR